MMEQERNNLRDKYGNVPCSFFKGRWVDPVLRERERVSEHYCI